MIRLFSFADGNAISEEEEEDDENGNEEDEAEEDTDESKPTESHSQPLPVPLIEPPPIPISSPAIDKGSTEMVRKRSMDTDDEDLFENPVSKAPLSSISEVNLFIEDAPLGQLGIATDEVHV